VFQRGRRPRELKGNRRKKKLPFWNLWRRAKEKPQKGRKGKAVNPTGVLAKKSEGDLSGQNCAKRSQKNNTKRSPTFELVAEVGKRKKVLFE